MMRPRLRRPPMQRAVVYFPSGLTLGNLFFGVWAIVSASRGNFTMAGWCVVLGGICDAFDGRVARATGTGGRFGEELDSLVDVVTFGLAPAMIMYFAVLHRDGFDWVFSFWFTACAVLRLARFNVSQAGTSKSYFQGLPSPAAGITLATYYWFSQSPLYTETAIEGWPWQRLVRVVMAALGFLMISNVPYPVVPNLSFRTVRGWIGIAFLVGGVSMLVFGRLAYFFPLAVIYIAFGLVRGVFMGWVERRQPDELEDSIPTQDLVEDEEYEREDLVDFGDREPRRRSRPRGIRAVPAAPAVSPAVRAPLPSGTVVGDAGGLDKGLEAAKRRRRRRRPRGNRPDGSSSSDTAE